MGRLALDLSGTPCLLDFDGFNRPLGVFAGNIALSLSPWTYRRHMEALRVTTHAAGTDLRLDTRRLAAAVLAGADLPDDLARRLEPVALWWAAGGDDALPSLPEEGEWLDLGAAGRARLRPWSERQRFSALSAALSGEGNDTWFDPVTYLDGMVRASLQVLDGPQALDDMDARGTAVLLHATVTLNLAGDQEDPLLDGGPAAREWAARTLRLCQALGWTPTRVWATPAAEIDRLLRMLDVLQPPPRPARAPRLSDHPDATVIHIEDDPPRAAP
ncbi:hypothetical protein [Zoogloea sp.]|uniref:hypothetical protein n=1 Tax=Zoogloea sp. TaxID=49181 RepID=UPI001B672487|nr:hypothetical protein [Zoogloea sp.]MBK6656316.1 hypothetical protein [Zoogloea sp.]MBP7446251.1 hypothetical protein [Zoogloea sp.]